MAGLVTDENGLRDVWFEYSLDGSAEHTHPFVGAAQQKTVVEVAERLDLRDGLLGADGQQVVPVVGR